MIGKEVVILSCTIKIVNNIVCHWKRVGEPPHVTHSINRLMHESASTRARSFQLVTAPSCLLYSVGERWSILKSWCSFTAIVTNNFTDCEHDICQYFRLMDPVCWGKQIIQSGNASVITYQRVTQAKQVKWMPSVRIWARDSMILSPMIWQVVKFIWKRYPNQQQKQHQQQKIQAEPSSRRARSGASDLLTPMSAGFRDFSDKKAGKKACSRPNTIFCSFPRPAFRATGLERGWRVNAPFPTARLVSNTLPYTTTHSQWTDPRVAHTDCIKLNRMTIIHFHLASTESSQGKNSTLDYRNQIH